MKASRTLVFRLQDAWPLVALPVIHALLTACRSGYRRESSLRAQLGTRVRGGPFAGMRYLRVASGSVLLPKLASTYRGKSRRSCDL